VNRVILSWEKTQPGLSRSGQMWSLKENSLAEELSRKTIMGRQGEILSGIAITVRISTASALKITAYKKHPMVVMVVEQAKPEVCKSKESVVRKIPISQCITVIKPSLQSMRTKPWSLVMLRVSLNMRIKPEQDEDFP
jgi:hypothetical protein